MVADQRVYFSILLIIYLHFFTSSFAVSQPPSSINASLLKSTSGLSTSWINRPSLTVNSRDIFPRVIVTPLLLRSVDNNGPRFLCGFYCDENVTSCLLSVLLFSFIENDVIHSPQLVWSANRHRPVKANATLQLGEDGNLVLSDSDGTLVWSTNITGQSVSGLNFTEMGNLVLFDKRNSIIWQSFDHPTDSLLPGQTLVPGQKLIASVSASNWSQGLLSLTILNGSVVAQVDSDPPQFYYADRYPDSPYFKFDLQTFTALPHHPKPVAQFMKLGHDGHLRVYQLDVLDWKEVSDILTPDVGNCGYPMVCGRHSICTNGGQCICPTEGNLFRTFNERKPHLGCREVNSISCNSSQYHSLLELKNTTYFAFEFIHSLMTSKFWLEEKTKEDCKRACLSNCSCKAAAFTYYWDGAKKGSCLLVNEVFSLIDYKDEVYKTVFLKVQNSSNAQNDQSSIISGGKKSRPFKVIIGSTLAALFGIIFSIS